MDRKEIKILLNFLENNREHLNPLQLGFLASIKNQYTSTWVLTKRQVDFLYDIKEYIRSKGLEESAFKAEPDRYMAQYSSFDHLTTFNI